MLHMQHIGRSFHNMIKKKGVDFILETAGVTKIPDLKAQLLGALIKLFQQSFLEFMCGSIEENDV